MPRVFLSYAREKARAATALVDALRSEQWEVFLDTEGIPAGAEWLQTINDEVARSDAVVFLVTEEWLNSRACRDELDVAVDLGKRLIPISLETDPDAAPTALRSRQFIFCEAESRLPDMKGQVMTAVQADWEWLKLHGWLRDRSSEWKRTDQNETELLPPQGVRRIDDALATRHKPDPPLADLQHEYLQRSRAGIERQRQRRIRILAGSTFAFAVLSVVAVVSAYFAVKNQNEAEKESRIALARQLAAQSTLIQEQQPSELSLSVLLAIESWRLHPSLEAEQTLRKGVMLMPAPINRMHLRRDQMIEAVFSHDQRYLATRTLDHQKAGEPMILWDVHTGEEVAKIDPQGSVWVSMAFAPTNEQLFGATTNGVVIWDLAQQTPVRGFEYRATRRHFHARPTVFSQSGRYLVTLQGQRASIWDMITQKSVRQINHEATILQAAFGGDDKYLALADEDNALVIWDLVDGEPVARHRFEQQIETITTSDARGIVAAVAGLDVHVWDMSKGKEVMRLRHGHGITSLAIDPQGTFLATASVDGTARLWHVAEGKILKPLTIKAPVTGVALSPKGEYLATANADRTVRIWDTRTGREVARAGHKNPVRAVSFSPDGSALASVSYEAGVDASDVHVWKVQDQFGVVRLSHTRLSALRMSYDGRYAASIVEIFSSTNVVVWDTVSGEIVASIPSHQGVADFDFSPNSSLLAIATGWQVEIWNLPDAQVPTVLRHQGRLESLRFAHDGTKLLTTSDDRTLRVWDVASKELFRVAEHESRAKRASFGPLGKRIALVTTNNTLELWDVDSLKKVADLPHEGPIAKFAFNPSGSQVVTSTRAGSVTIWSSESGAKIRRIDYGTGVHTFKIDPQGERLIIADGDQVIRVLDLATWEKLSDWKYEGKVAAFSPNASYVATVSGRYISVREVATGEIITRIDNGENVNGVLFAPDDRRLAAVTFGLRKHINVWTWHPQGLIDAVCDRVSENLHYEEWRRYFSDQPYRVTCKTVGVHPSVIRAGKRLLKKGELDSGVALLRHAADADPTASIDVENERRKAEARMLVAEATDHAKKQKIDDAVKLFHRAIELDPQIKIEPTDEARRLAAQALNRRALLLAKEADVEGATAVLQRAKQLDSSLVNDPREDARHLAMLAVTEMINRARKLARQGSLESSTNLLSRLHDNELHKGRIAAERQARVWYAEALLLNANWFSQRGKVEKALAAFDEAKTLNPEISVSGADWNRVCWYGSLLGKANQVLDACEQAVFVTSNSNLSKNKLHIVRKSRGLARAMTGDFDGAIEDFQSFVEGADDASSRQQFQEYAEKLGAGTNPFTQYEIDRLLNR